MRTMLTYRLGDPAPDEDVRCNGADWLVCECGDFFGGMFTTPIGEKRLATRRDAWLAAHEHRVMEMDG